jgi:hypothetical protein
LPAHDPKLLSLVIQNLLDLANLFLSFAEQLLGFAFGLQLGIIGNFPAISLTVPFAS